MLPGSMGLIAPTGDGVQSCEKNYFTKMGKIFAEFSELLLEFLRW